MAALTREKIQDGIADTDNAKSVVRPYVMSHGTMECYSLKESRKFYEEFLGLECVRHAKPAMVVRCGLKFHIVAVEVGAGRMLEPEEIVEEVIAFLTPKLLVGKKVLLTAGPTFDITSNPSTNSAMMRKMRQVSCELLPLSLPL